MADIQEKVLKKYGIDIAQENIFKLYKIENPNLSESELQMSIDSTRKRWTQSINGANEKNAERDSARLANANKYEAVLRDSKLRKEVYEYYSKGGSSEKSSSSNGTDSGSVEFAREYFKLVETTKKIKKDDVDFFFSYYQAQRKNKKSILEMLEKDFKVHGLGKGKGFAGEDEEIDKDGKKKDESSPLIANLFQEATVLKLKKCLDLYEVSKQSTEICQKYPSIRESLYDFLGLKEIETIQRFSELVSSKAKEVYAIRQEKGTEYVPLVDLFNVLKELSDYRDVVDNVSEFKLLLKYPTLTPYMYAFVEMKPTTLKGLVNIANRDYVFRDETDFILTYYNPVHDNFGISNGGINSLVKKAEKKAKQNKILNEIDEKLGRKKKRKLSIGAEIIHWLVYWPVFAVYFVFEVFKAIFTELHRFAIPVFIAIFIGESWLFPKLLGFENLLIFRNILSKEKWYDFLTEFIGETINNGFEAVIMTLMVLVLMIVAYGAIPLFVSVFIAEFCDDLNKRYDWVGYERTFQNIFQQLRTRTENQYINQKKIFFKQKMLKVLLNLISLIVLIAIIHFTPIAFKEFSERTGYFQREENVSEIVMTDNVSDEVATSTDEIVEEVIIMVIYGGTSNIRSGPSVDYDVIKSVPEGTEFVATGNEEVASNGKTWYEVYLNDEKTETEWASQSVIKFKE